MCKPRDFDSEMKALNDRAKLLQERKLHQLGEIVIATGADMLPIDVLAGALLVAVETELGGLVAKAGLIELTDDDRAVLFGTLSEVAARLRSEERDHCLTLWRRRGKRAFGDDAAWSE